MPDFSQARDLASIDTDGFLLPTAVILGAQATRGDQTLLEGGTYWVRQQTLVNRILLRMTGGSGAPTLAIGLYQSAEGGAGVASRVAGAVAFPIGVSAANYSIPLAEGEIVLRRGYLYVLYGRDSAAGGYTMRAYGAMAADLHNQQMIAGTRPTNYTTTLAANAGLPATFDPRENGSGGQAVPSAANNTMPILRVARV